MGLGLSLIDLRAAVDGRDLPVKGGGLNAHDRGDRLPDLRASGGAAADARLAQDQFFREVPAAGEAAGAAVSAGKNRHQLADPRILFHAEIIRRETEKPGKHQTHDAQNQNRNQYHHDPSHLKPATSRCRDPSFLQPLRSLG